MSSLLKIFPSFIGLSMTLLDYEAKAQKLILSEMLFHFEMHRTADFHPNLLVSWELVTEGYHFTHFIKMRDQNALIR